MKPWAGRGVVPLPSWGWWQRCARLGCRWLKPVFEAHANTVDNKENQVWGRAEQKYKNQSSKDSSSTRCSRKTIWQRVKRRPGRLSRDWWWDVLQVCVRRELQLSMKTQPASETLLWKTHRQETHRAQKKTPHSNSKSISTIHVCNVHFPNMFWTFSPA